jgi:hypothetical protein
MNWFELTTLAVIAQVAVNSTTLRMQNIHCEPHCHPESNYIAFNMQLTPN